MISAGIDIGSRTVKLVLVKNGEIEHSQITENSFDPIGTCKNLLENIQYDRITATGYGRNLFGNHFESKTISEIKAFAIGARAFFPSCRTILDIGGQDTKTISLNEHGKLNKFEMNDKCAAGTGKFLEIMAMALGFSLYEFGEKALTAETAEKVNNMCTVFAESEVISLVAAGARRENVALGLHQSIAVRAVSMLKRLNVTDDVAFVGGVALNPCIKKLVKDALHKEIFTTEQPQIVGALGCALHGLTNT
jgi:predicted CoA-substrate-specific enzyme activase